MMDDEARGNPSPMPPSKISLADVFGFTLGHATMFRTPRWTIAGLQSPSKTTNHVKNHHPLVNTTAGR